MTRLILLVGLLIYSSVGWSKTLMMECFQSFGSSLEVSVGIYKLETDEKPTSSTFVTQRVDGSWRGFCHVNKNCQKGDDSTFWSGTDKDGFPYKIQLDFKFLRMTMERTEVDTNGVSQVIERQNKCRRIN